MDLSGVLGTKAPVYTRGSQGLQGTHPSPRLPCEEDSGLVASWGPDDRSRMRSCCTPLVGYSVNTIQRLVTRERLGLWVRKTSP